MKDYSDEDFVSGLKEQIELINSLVHDLERARLPHQSVSAQIDHVRSNLKSLKARHEPEFDWGFLSSAVAMKLW